MTSFNHNWKRFTSLFVTAALVMTSGMISAKQTVKAEEASIASSTEPTTYTITYNVGPDAADATVTGDSTATAGKELTFTVTPAENYKIDTVKIGDTELEGTIAGTSTDYTITVDENKVVDITMTATETTPAEDIKSEKADTPELSDSGAADPKPDEEQPNGAPSNSSYSPIVDTENVQLYVGDTKSFKAYFTNLENGDNSIVSTTNDKFPIFGNSGFSITGLSVGTTTITLRIDRFVIKKYNVTVSYKTLPVYVYVKPTAALSGLGLTENSDGFYTIGKVELELPDASTKRTDDDKLSGTKDASEEYGIYLTQVQIASIKSQLEDVANRWDKNIDLDLSNINLNGYINSASGAVDYDENSDYTWHLNGYCEPTYTVNYVIPGYSSMDYTATETDSTKNVPSYSYDGKTDDPDLSAENKRFAGWTSSIDYGFADRIYTSAELKAMTVFDATQAYEGQDGEVTYTAVLINQHVLTTSIDNGGTISEGKTFDEDQEETLTVSFKPADNYTITSIYVDDEKLTGDELTQAIKNGFVTVDQKGDHDVTVLTTKNEQPATTTTVAETKTEQFLVTFLDCKGNTVKVEWVNAGENATAPTGFGTYSGYWNVTSHRDLKPDACGVNNSFVVPNTADKN